MRFSFLKNTEIARARVLTATITETDAKLMILTETSAETRAKPMFWTATELPGCRAAGLDFEQPHYKSAGRKAFLWGNECKPESLKRTLCQ